MVVALCGCCLETGSNYVAVDGLELTMIPGLLPAQSEHQLSHLDQGEKRVSL